MKRSIMAVTMQIAVVPTCRQKMLTALLDYATGSQNISGLESIFLTLLYAEYRNDAPKSALFQRGAKLWGRSSQKNTLKSIGPLAVFDVHREQLLLISAPNATEIVKMGINLDCDFGKTLASKATFIGNNIFPSALQGQPPGPTPEFVLVGDAALEDDIGVLEFRATGGDIWPYIKAAAVWVADKAVAFWHWLSSFEGEQLASEISDALGDFQSVDA
ncbi:hypothetical protein VE04_10355 [Pseudogymnoascus sp. 24MN13]|nr:hypothetical protein VE04_10355 [Pseudogymnoascus sp. 24MN13]